MAQNNLSALVKLVVDKAQARTTLQRELKELQKDIELETGVKVNISDIKQARREIEKANREQQEGTKENIKFRAQQLANTRMLAKETKANADLEDAKNRQSLLQTKAKNKETIEGLKQERLLLQENRKLEDERNKKSTTQKNLDKIQHLSSTGSFAKQVSDATVEYNKLSTVTDDLKADFAELQRLQTVLGTSQTDEELISNYEKFNITLEKVKNAMHILRNEQNGLGISSEINASQKSIDSLANSMASFRDNNTKMTKDMKARLNDMYKTLINGANLSQAEVSELRTRFSQLKLEVRDAGKLGKSFGDSIKAGMASFATWLPASQLIMASVNAFRSAIDNVRELDDSLLELSKVSDLSADGLVKVTEEAYELGETVGRTGRQVVDAVTEFKRAGFELNDSMDMAEAALVMTNVAEGINDTADAAGTLISVLKGYNMAESETMSIVDMLNSTSNQSPIGFDELAEGLERTAGTMAQSGTTIQETIGLITAGYAQLRNVERVSTSLITLSARLRGVNEDGEEIDGLSAELEESFGKIGVAIEDTDGNLRSIYQIAQDYAKVMPTLTSEQKQYYAELAAGKRNVTTWNAITQQFQDAEKATAQAIDSVGSASEENQKYLDSISGKVSQFNSAVEHLSSTIIDSELIKFFVDLGTVGVNAVDGLISALTPLGTLALGGSAFAIFKNVDYLKMPVCPHHV